MRRAVCTAESSSANKCEISWFDPNAAQPPLWLVLARFDCGFGVRIRVSVRDRGWVRALTKTGGKIPEQPTNPKVRAHIL